MRVARQGMAQVMLVRMVMRLLQLMMMMQIMRMREVWCMTMVVVRVVHARPERCQAHRTSNARLLHHWRVNEATRTCRMHRR